MDLVRPVDRSAVEADRAREASREERRRSRFAFGRVTAPGERDDEALRNVRRPDERRRRRGSPRSSPRHVGLSGDSRAPPRANIRRCRQSKRPVKSRSFRSSGSRSTPSSRPARRSSARCPVTVGAPPNSATCPICLGFPGHAARPEPPGRDARAAARDGRRGDDPPRVAVRAQELLLPGPAQGLPDHASTTGRSRRAERSRSTRPQGEKAIRLVRIHLEEDAGKLLHDTPYADVPTDVSLVDWNRAGVPLVEIVSEPDLRSAEEAAAYLTELRRLLRYTGVCDGDMEKGNLRCDANVSVRPSETAPFGTRVEIKNLNSIRFVAKAIEHEIERQAEALARGEKIVQETRLWDEKAGRTVSMRGKEEAHDYRYFPEPDLGAARRRRGLDRRGGRRNAGAAARAPARASSKRLRPRRRRTPRRSSRPASSPTTSRGPASAARPKLAANWVTGEVLRWMKERRISAEEALVLSDLAGAARGAPRARSSRGRSRPPRPRKSSRRCSTRPRTPRTIVEEKGLGALRDAGALDAVVAEIVSVEPVAGRAVPLRQDPDLRLVRRSGHEEDRRPGRSRRGPRGADARPRRRTAARDPALPRLEEVRARSGTPCSTSRSTSSAGEFVFLTGPSGAGKSTLLKPALPRGAADRRADHRQRPQHRRAPAVAGPVPPAHDGRRLPGLQAHRAQDRLREHLVRAERARARRGRSRSAARTRS